MYLQGFELRHSGKDITMQELATMPDQLTTTTPSQ